MKLLILSLLFILTSCALFDDFKSNDMNWFGDPKFKSKNSPETSPETVETKEVQPPLAQFVEKKSLNWEYSSVKDIIDNKTNYFAKTNSKDKIAILTIAKNDHGALGVEIHVHSGKTSYQEGHSIIMKVDDNPNVLMVEPTADSASDIRLKEPEKFIDLIKGHKHLKVEILLDKTGARNFDFDVSDLQEYFH